MNQDASTSANRSRRRVAPWRVDLRSWDAIVSVVMLLLIAGGISMSSIGVEGLRDDPEKFPGLLLNHPDGIRGDEFLRGGSQVLGTMKDQDNSFLSPLAWQYPPSAQSSVRRWAWRITNLETYAAERIGTWLPDQAFAFRWWFYPWVVLLLLPVWMRRMGVPRHLAIGATILTVISPLTIWWSLFPLMALTWALAAGLAGDAAVRSWRIRSPDASRRRAFLITAAWVLVGGIALQRLIFNYQPWSIPVGAFMILPLVAAAWRRAGWRTTLPVTSSIVTLGGGLAYWFYASGGMLEVLAGTVYPGARRLGGGMESLAQLFAGPHLWILATSPAMVDSNLSEIASSLSVLGVSAIVLAAAVNWACARERTAVVTWFVVLVPLTIWCTAAFPQWSEQIPVLNLIHPRRMAQMLGIAFVLSFAIVLGAWSRTDRSGRAFPTAMFTAGATFFIALMAGSNLRTNYIPEYDTEWIAIMSTAVAVGAFIAVRWPARWFALAPLAALSVIIVAPVPPIQAGPGDLRDGSAAATVRAVSDELEEGDRWATDQYWTDSLLVANAIPSLSGQQNTGPNEEAWRRFAPEVEEELWNRGAAYITFVWKTEPGFFEIVNTSPDFIVIAMDPCEGRLERFDVRFVMSTTELTNDCLEPVEEFDFGGMHRWVYELT